MSDKLILEIRPGRNIQEACAMAQKIADTTSMTVVFDFNGVECVALKGGQASVLAELQQEAQSHKPSVSSHGAVA